MSSRIIPRPGRQRHFDPAPVTAYRFEGAERRSKHMDDFGRPLCMECGALAIRDGTGECRDCRRVRIGHDGDL